MSLYLYSTGELLRSLKGHSNEITALKADYMNKIIISSSLDSSIIIQKENKMDFEIKRKMINGHYHKQIILMEASIYHNLFITGVRDNILYVWDYEYARLVGSITIEEDAEPTAIIFINGYSVIIISTTRGTIHFFHFTRKDSSFIEISNIAIINADQKDKALNYSDMSPYNKMAFYPNKLLVDLLHDSERQKETRGSMAIYITK